MDKKKKALQDAKAIDDGTMADDFIPGLAKKAEELSIEKQLETEGVTYFRFRWLTGGASYRKDSYTTYDSLLSFAKRIDSRDFDKWTLKLAYNFFWQRTDAWIDYIGSKFINSVYFNLNYSLVRINSFEDLKDQTLSITRVRVQNDTTYEFASQKKVKDISKKTYSNDWMQQVGGTLTAMMGKKQFFGLNLSSQTEITSDKTVWNERLGLLFRFLNSEKDKSKVNFELFLALNDVSDEAKTNKSAWKRKEIGVSLNVPFEKVFFR
jgi:hypothetical protein